MVSYNARQTQWGGGADDHLEHVRLARLLQHLVLMATQRFRPQQPGAEIEFEFQARSLDPFSITDFPGEPPD
ncbi:MAG: hypothetical protein CMJ62_13350 [Planctomycetaceae bacterium]|nr:hypothetical protein [Planctomycetaceae bacterium]